MHNVPIKRRKNGLRIHSLLCLIFCPQTATVENECDRKCSNETRTSMDSLRKCTLMKERNATYRNMDDAGFDALVSESQIIEYTSRYICLHNINEVPSMLSITYSTFHPGPREETEFFATVQAHQLDNTTLRNQQKPKM